MVEHKRVCLFVFVFVWLCFCVRVFVFAFCLFVFLCFCCVCVWWFVFLCVFVFVSLRGCVFVAIVKPLTPDHSKLMFNSKRTCDHQQNRAGRTKLRGNTLIKQSQGQQKCTTVQRNVKHMIGTLLNCVNIFSTHDSPTRLKVKAQTPKILL